MYHDANVGRVIYIFPMLNDRNKRESRFEDLSESMSPPLVSTK